jgi:hypothetical protein
MKAFLYLPSLQMYYPMTIISIESWEQLSEATASVLSFKQGVENQNHHLHYPQDTSIGTVTVTKDSLVLTQGRTNHMVLAQQTVPNNDLPPAWPCPTTHYPDGQS